MPPGFPNRVSQTDWRRWLENAPVTAGTTLLDAMQVSRHMRKWLTGVPSPDLLSPAERLAIGDDLLHLCEQLADEVSARSSSGGIAVVVAFAGTMACLIFPPAAPAIALGTLVIGGGSAANAHHQWQRQTELDEAIRLTRRLAWNLRQ